MNQKESELAFCDNVVYIKFQTQEVIAKVGQNQAAAPNHSHAEKQFEDIVRFSTRLRESENRMKVVSSACF